MIYIKHIFGFCYTSMIYFVITIIQYAIKKLKTEKNYFVYLTKKIFNNKKLKLYIFFIFKW